MSQKGFEKKLKIGGVLDFTADFGLKVSQVTAGFGYGEGYYHRYIVHPYVGGDLHCREPS